MLLEQFPYPQDDESAEEHQQNQPEDPFGQVLKEGFEVLVGGIFHRFRSQPVFM